MQKIKFYAIVTYVITIVTFEIGQDRKVAAIRLKAMCNDIFYDKNGEFMTNTTLIFNKLYNLSQRAYKKKYVPISALVVDQNGKIIAIGYNKTTKNSVTTHAEIYALNQACRKKRTNKISDCSIWVTVEPCMMCLGAIINSGIKVINYYLLNKKYGFLKSNHTFDVSKLKVQYVRKHDENMILKDLMKKFFKQLR